MRFPYDTPPDSSKMSRDEIRAYNARVASWVYNDEHRADRNMKTRARMAKLRAAEADLLPEERETRREARRASARKYRENNRDNLAHRERKRRSKQRKTPEYQEKYTTFASYWKISFLRFSRDRLRLLREKRREDKQRGSSSAELPLSGQSGNSSAAPPPADLFSSLNQRRRPMAMPLTPLADLASPPPEFIPCEIPNYLGSNWRNHAQFSGWGNRTYWVLLLGSKQGVYSLKVTCLGAIEGTYKASEAMEGFQRWEHVLPAWAKHCFHRHGRCATHTFACSDNACPEHPRPAGATTAEVIRVKREPGVAASAPAALRERTIKRDPDAGSAMKRGSPPPRIKEDPSAPARKVESPAPKARSPPLSIVVREKKPVRSGPRRAPPPTYTPTPVPETDSDTEMPTGGVPLYDPDSSDDNMDGGGALGTSPASSPTPGARGGEDVAKRVRRLEEIKQAYVPRQRKSQAVRSPLFTPGVSAGSSVSTPPASSPSVSTPPATSAAVGGAKGGNGRDESASTARAGPSAAVRGTKGGKRREESASTARAGPSRLAQPSWDDPFYVVGGTIHHSSQKAFDDVVNGPVKVVMGWDAATRAAREAVGAHAEGKSASALTRKIISYLLPIPQCEMRRAQNKKYYASTLPIPGPEEIVTTPPFSRRLRARMLTTRGEWRKGDELLENFLERYDRERGERKQRASLKEAAKAAEARMLARKKTRYLRRLILLERLQEVRALVEAGTEHSTDPHDWSCATSDSEKRSRRKAMGGEWREFARSY
ncbi:hypothetical protein B0H11DRAFT_1899426 [Mycena galericulata]|nr:hypothetical protein B0H11DRAFT_1899426 [Mycena galericulata]